MKKIERAAPGVFEQKNFCSLFVKKGQEVARRCLNKMVTSKEGEASDLTNEPVAVGVGGHHHDLELIVGSCRGKGGGWICY